MGFVVRSLTLTMKHRMRHSYLFFAAAAFAVAAAPLGASAHEHQVFEIGGKIYEFTIGSLNEPVTVDDKTGVEVRVKLMGEVEAGEHHDEGAAHEEAAGTPVTGLEQTLKVQLQAGGKTKTLDLAPAYNDPGAYRAPFFPTVQTTYTYRLVGTVNNTPVDLSFACNPAGHPRAADDVSRVSLSDGVTRTLKQGAFGCPAAKADMGFPEQSSTMYETRSGLSALAVQSAAGAASAKTIALAGVMLGFLGLITGLAALFRKRGA